MTTEILPARTPAELAEAVERAVAVLRCGDPVGLPTETVYGLAADALRVEALTKIFEAKERPFFDPLIVHLPDLDWLERFVDLPIESRPLVEALIAKYWSGPLTLVLPRRAIVPDLVTAGMPTVAVRMSAHPVFRAVCRAFGSPLAAPSANRFGRISPTSADHVRSELDGRIPLILDGGSTQHGVESTIVAVEGESLRLLRAGPVTPEELAGVWQALRRARNDPPREEEVMAFYQRLGVSYSGMLSGGFEVRIEAPGQLESHYAPRTPLRVREAGMHFRWHQEARRGLLAFSQRSTVGEYACEEILSPTGDLREAAATLFAKLRRLDEAGLDWIVAEPVPEHGLGIAIMDRLRKAAAKHAK